MKQTMKNLNKVSRHCQNSDSAKKKTILTRPLQSFLMPRSFILFINAILGRTVNYNQVVLP